MYTPEDVKRLVDDEAHIVYVKDYKGDLSYYSIRPESLASLFNTVYSEGFKDGSYHTPDHNLDKIFSES